MMIQLDNRAKSLRKIGAIAKKPTKPPSPNTPRAIRDSELIVAKMATVNIGTAAAHMK
jgi:hypothetical protein